MDALFHPLPTTPLPANTDLLHLEDRPGRPVTHDSCALEVMTDLRVLDPVSITEDATLDAAHALMVDAKDAKALGSEAQRNSNSTVECDHG